MSATSLLKECQKRKITLRMIEGQIHFKAPKGALTEDLKEALRRHRSELMNELSKNPAFPPDYFERYIRAAVLELNYMDVRMTDVPEAKRHKSLELEEEFTAAANRGDREQFLKLLTEWRNCFH